MEGQRLVPGPEDAAVCGSEEVVGGWRLRRDGRARIEMSGDRMLLCMGPSEALYYSNAEVSDGGFDRLPHRRGVLEVTARLTGLHHGSAGWGFWNYSMRIDGSYPIWFIYLNAPGPYPLKGLWAQTGNLFTPVTILDPGGIMDRLQRLLARLHLAPVIRLTRLSPSLPGLDPTEPHRYRVEWRDGAARFYVDDRLVASHPARSLEARVDIWIDNAVYLPRRGDPAKVYRHVTMANRAETCLEITGS